MSFESKVGRRFHIYRFYRPLDNGDLGNDIADLMRRRGEPVYLNVASSSTAAACGGGASQPAGTTTTSTSLPGTSVRIDTGSTSRGTTRWRTIATPGQRRLPGQLQSRPPRFPSRARNERPLGGRFRRQQLQEKPASVRRYLPRRYDMIGVDGYNRARKWRSPVEIFGAAHHFAAKRGALGCSSGRSDPRRAPRTPRPRRTWITSAADTFQRWNVGVVLWTNSPSDSGDYAADSSQDSLQAYQRAGDVLRPVAGRGGDGRNRARTCDLPRVKRTLSQLSYAPRDGSLPARVWMTDRYSRAPGRRADARADLDARCRGRALAPPRAQAAAAAASCAATPTDL